MSSTTTTLTGAPSVVGSRSLSGTSRTSTFTTPMASLSSSSTSASAYASTHAARVRFDAECVLIPEQGPSSNSRRPRIVTKSYALPFWKKPREERTSAGEDEHLVIKVALPSFSSGKKHSSHSRERGGRNNSRSPPSPAVGLLSCLRSPNTSVSIQPNLPSLAEHPPSPPIGYENDTLFVRDQPAVQETLGAIPHSPLISLSTIFTSPSTSTTISAVNSPNQAERIPLRACCPECGLRADVVDEAFSRGAMRMRRRAAPGTLPIGDSLLEAARRGGYLDLPAACEDDLDEDAGKLISGTGLAEVNRLVAALEEKRAKRARNGSKSPTPDPSPLGTPCEEKQEISLLGPAIGRVSATGTPRVGSGRASPLLPLGIAVDEVDKERRRVSLALAVDLASEDEYPGPSTRTPLAQPVPILPRPRIIEDDADLFPLPSSRGSTPRTTPVPSPAGSDISIHVVADGEKKSSPLLSAALTAQTHRVTGSTNTACVVLGATGRREREARDASRLLVPASASSSREPSLERSTDNENDSATQKPLPLIPPLAASILAAGPYSPALLPRPAQSPSSHARIVSAPADVPITDHPPSSFPKMRPSPTRAKSASTSSVSRPALPLSDTPPMPHRPGRLARTTSNIQDVVTSDASSRRPNAISRQRSLSSSSKGTSGRKGGSAFGTFVDVLKGMGSPGVSV